MRLLSSGSVLATHALLEAAFVYNILMLAARSLNENDEVTTAQQISDNLADLVYAYHLFMFVLGIFIDGGFRRDRAGISAELSSRFKHILLHLVANTDFSWVDRDIQDALPFSLRVVRLLIAPIVGRNLLGIEDITLPIAKDSVWQFLLIAGAWTLTSHPDLQLFDVMPVTILGAYFAFLFIVCIFRSKPAENAPQATDKEKEESEGGEKDLETVCRDMIKRAKLLKLVMERHPEEFMSDIMSMLKHETFQPGQKLATIGEVGHHMFFLARGTVVGSTANNKQFKLGAGTSFGEIALMRPMSKRTATLAALTKCEVFLLNQEAFDRLRSTYPALAHSVRLEVAKYLRNDSALYVTICMAKAMRCCYTVGISFLTAVYLVILVLK